MNIKRMINEQRRQARANIAKIRLHSRNTVEAAEQIRKEREFLNSDLSGILLAEELLKVAHTRHNAQSFSKCNECIKLADQLVDMENEEEAEGDILPRFGNLLAILEQEVAQEKSQVESRRMPSQNDLTRWALKDAVLQYYQGLHFPEDLPIVDNRYDDRLITDLAPDFDVIADIWLTKLDELKRRTDKYGLILEEFDKAENDLYDGMRGSAFEKQLDRYREEFMQKLMR